MDIRQIAEIAKTAALKMGAVDSATKNRALYAILEALTSKKNDIRVANKADMERAENQQLAPPLLKRLKFDEEKIDEVVRGLESLMSLPDPVGETLSATELDEGLELYKVTAPIGVIGVIFESRPDALVQISALCLKSGNAVLLKGGSEAMETNRVLSNIIVQASASAGLPEGWLGLLETRSDVAEMLSLNHHIDLIVPRGSNEFVQHIMNHTHIPVMGHADGICHVYIDKTSDVAMAEKIVVDSKCQYVAVCNAAESMLVHQDIAKTFLPSIQSALEAKGVELRGCERVRQIIDIKTATSNDWATEYLDLILSVKVVDNLDDAIHHINRYGSGHTDVIVASDSSRADRFMDHVDSADVLVNCSSRFADGFRFGLGAEVGISTNKIHARGPVGMEGLLIYKWRLIGSGHIVADYAGKKGKTFTHRKLSKQYGD